MTAHALIASPTPPDLRALLTAFKAEVFADLNCHQVGQIVSFNAALQTAVVQLSLQRSVNGGLVAYPLLTDCPVLVLNGGGASLTFPIAAGDPCFVLFNDTDIDKWFTTGNVVAPNTGRTHSLSDGLVIVGARNLSNRIPDYSMLGIELRHPGIALTGNVRVSTGATGFFSSAEGLVITVADGIIINIA